MSHPSSLCVNSPTQRSLSLNSLGTANACDGVLSLEINDYWSTHPAALATRFLEPVTLDAAKEVDMPVVRFVLLTCVMSSASFAWGQRLLYQVDGAVAGEQFGHALDANGVIGGSPARDLVAGALFFQNSGAKIGRVAVLDGLDGATLLSIPGQEHEGWFGNAVAFIRDLDNDGIDELLVGEPRRDVNGVVDSGCARVISGSSGQTTQMHCLSAADEWFGWRLDELDDLDGDGRSELLVATPRHDEGPAANAGLVRILSSQSGAVLIEVAGVQSGQGLGQHARAIADIDGDGRRDFAAGSPFELVLGWAYAGCLRAYSSRTGLAIWERCGTSYFEGFGQQFAPTGDVDGDGIGDVLVATGPNSVGYPGRLSIVSGATGSELRELTAPPGSFGSQVSAISEFDFNADSIPDVAIGGPSQHVASVVVLSGRDGNLLFHEVGQNAQMDSFGRSLAGLQDVNGDFADELAAGAPTANPGGLSSAGAVRVYAGEPGLQFTHYGRAGALNGATLALAGDFDGDGVGDVLVGAPLEDVLVGHDDRGAARVVSGATGRELARYEGVDSFERLGSAACSLGDLDGDGTPDYALGAPGDTSWGQAGRVRVVSGATGAALLTIASPGTVNELFGSAVANVGDLDGDSFDDLAVGSANGWSFLVHSSLSGALLGGAGTSGVLLGSSLSGWIDYDGDGKREVVVAQPGTSAGLGWVRVYSGQLNGASMFDWVGAAPGDRFGEALADVGDLNGDGKRDLAIGAPGFDGAAGLDAGRVYVYSGANGQLIRTFDGVSAGDRLGESIAEMGDLDCDLTNEVVIGGGVTVSNDGFARIVSGASGALIALFRGVHASSGFGSAVTSPGDLNGDGRADIVVGAPFARFAGVSDYGHVKAYTTNTFFAPSTRYCVSKTNSLGCTPTIESSGSPALVSSCEDFHVRAVNVIGQTTGYLSWGLGPNSSSPGGAPFHSSPIHELGVSILGSTKCVRGPLRTANQRAGGTLGQCDGVFDFHMDSLFFGLNSLFAGHTVYAQWWYHDPLHPDGSSIGHTDALKFTIIL